MRCMGSIIDFISVKMSDLIRKHRTEISAILKKEISDEQLEVLEYGFYNLTSEIIKTTLLLVIAFVLGILKYSVIALLAFGFLRKCAGGVHAKKSHLACFTSNIIINFSTIFLAIILARLDKMVSLEINFLIFCICLICLVLYSPADVEEKPIGSKKQKRLLQQWSIALLCIYYFLSIILNDNLIGNLFILSALGEVFTILPITYRLTNNKRGDIEAFMREF